LGGRGPAKIGEEASRGYQRKEDGLHTHNNTPKKRVWFLEVMDGWDNYTE